jgi:hypothetical protein
VTQTEIEPWYLTCTLIIRTSWEKKSGNLNLNELSKKECGEIKLKLKLNSMV